jgi:hypothetical protein
MSALPGSDDRRERAASHRELMEPGRDINKSEPRPNWGEFLSINNFGEIRKSAGNSLLMGLTASIENLRQPQTRQNNPTIFAMLHRNLEA